MTNPNPDHLRQIKTFPSLVKYLRDELEWPIKSDNFDELMFDYEPEELGLDAKAAVHIKQIKQLRPLVDNQPWGIFFVNFEPKRLPVVVLRRILRSLVIKNRQSANRPHGAAWQLHDLLFISSYGEADHRDITFAHFSEDTGETGSLPTFRVLGWDDEDTVLHLAPAHATLKQKLRWPEDEGELDAWRLQWSSAFTLRHREVISTSKALAVRMAELASAIRKRANRVLSVESEEGQLRKLMSAFKEALIHDLSDDDFADMYAQTITYGLLTARVSRPGGLVADNIADMVPITNPFLKELMETFLNVGGRRNGSSRESGIDFDELGVNDVVDTLRAANMEAVLRDFGDKNPQEDPVIHFYEDFLKEYDAQKRMKRGVFYTPRPVVSFIVRSVDELLRTEFGLADGLADTTTWGEMIEKHEGLTLPTRKVQRPNSPDLVDVQIDASTPFVQILDPATGTGTFLVEVIDLIHKTMTAKWETAAHMPLEFGKLWNDYVTKHLLPRLHGYELMMAPYAIAHMKIGLKLYETGYRFESDERARVYLTNALEPPQDFSGTLAFAIPALAHEAEAVNAVKRDQRFTVMIGNPPYARHSSNPGKTATGVLTFIGRLVEEYKAGCPELHKPAQAKYLQDDYVKFICFAEWSLRQAECGVLGFITNHGYLDNPTFRGMRRHVKTTFSRLKLLDVHGNSKKKEVSPLGGAEENVFDIQQGVSIVCAVMHQRSVRLAEVEKADLWGARADKYAFLLENDIGTVKWNRLPSVAPFHLFIAQNEEIRSEYETFPKISEVFSKNGNPAPGVVTTHDQFAIAFTKDAIAANVEALLQTQTEDEARKLFRLCTQDQWHYHTAKEELASGEWRNEIGKILYRPFDVRWTVYNRRVAVHRRQRVSRHMIATKNVSLITARANRSPSMDHFFCSRYPSETKCGESTIQSCLMPLYLVDEGCGHQQSIVDERVLAGCNIPNDWLHRISCQASPNPEQVFDYAYATFFSPSYRHRYAEFLKIDFPRLVLPGSRALFDALAQVGRQLVDLHLMESPKLGNHITTLVGAREFRVHKVSYSNETVWIDKAKTHGFRGVPEEVWNFHIGGYQVCEKWLKDRQAKGGKNPRPGRVLTDEDIDHYQKIVVALSETIRIMGEIDEVIETHGGWPDAFATGKTAAKKKRK